MEAGFRKAGNAVIAAWKFQQGANVGSNGQPRPIREEFDQRYDTTGPPLDSIEQEADMGMNNSFPQSEHTYEGSNQSQRYNANSVYPSSGFANANQPLHHGGYTNPNPYDTYQQQQQYQSPPQPAPNPSQYGTPNYGAPQAHGPSYGGFNSTGHIHGSATYNQGPNLEAQHHTHSSATYHQGSNPEAQHQAYHQGSNSEAQPQTYSSGVYHQESTPEAQNQTDDMQPFGVSYNPRPGQPMERYPFVGQKQRAYTVHVTETGPLHHSPSPAQSPDGGTPPPLRNNDNHVRGDDMSRFDDILNSAGARAQREGQRWQHGARSSTNAW